MYANSNSNCILGSPSNPTKYGGPKPPKEKQAMKKGRHLYNIKLKRGLQEYSIFMDRLPKIKKSAQIKELEAMLRTLYDDDSIILTDIVRIS